MNKTVTVFNLSFSPLFSPFPSWKVFAVLENMGSIHLFFP